jgi:2-keto-4-pentenoate hydratase/2-oxohepta-3-ene-1,7-dioic acid hydratase in catechol pathway
MDEQRRTFLKTTGLAGAATLASAGFPATPAAAQTLARTSEPRDLPRNMTFATLRRAGGYGLGLKTAHGVLDVAAASAEYGMNAPTTIDAVLQGIGDITALPHLVERAKASPAADRLIIPVDKAAFGPCVTNPEKIFGIGLNYRKHAAETGAQIPTEPRLFNKFATALNNHGGTIVVSEEPAQKFDYEAELVIVIGRKARHVSEADALNYVFGYCTGNDFSARDLQARQTMLGKAGDGWAPVGPWLVTADQVDGDNLKIECRVNGEVRQSSNTADMVFGCRKLVSYLSTYMTLKPGDIIFTGTPEGVILGKPKDQQVWLKAGDRIVTSIEKLGELEFKLV